jgi:hypothetical protein
MSKLGMIFAKTAVNVGRVGMRQMARKQMAQKAKAKGKKPRDEEGCTPCAAKARGVEMANSIWK